MSDMVLVVLIAAALVVVIVALSLNRRLKLRRDGVDVGGGTSQVVGARDNASIKKVGQKGKDGMQSVHASGNASVGIVEQNTTSGASDDDK